MRVRDVQPDPESEPMARIEAVAELLRGEDRHLLRALATEHVLRFYEFDRAARTIGSISRQDLEPAEVEDPEQGAQDAIEQLFASLEPDGQSTQVLHSLRQVLHDLQGQRLAGVVLLTDGRETPAQPIADALAAVRNFGTKIYPVPIGSDEPPRNIEVQTVNVQDTAFKGDIVNVRATIRGTGYAPGHPVTVILKDQSTDLPLIGPDGQPVRREVMLADDNPQEVELHFKPEEVGTLDLVVEAVPQPGEIDEEDNIRIAQISVLDAQINVIYVDGYPRWEYRYIRDEMIRDETVLISSLLTSADPSFSHEGNIPIRRFPESMEELMEYDVVLFGDVDPRQFTDRQLQLVAEFVAEKGGGFGMVAGPRWSPAAYRNTAIAPVLPVNIARVPPNQGIGHNITEGFRPVITPAGQNSSIFRFLPDREENLRYITEDLQPLFWYLQGVTVKPGVGEVLAEHPGDFGPDGRKAPLLVIGRYGAGRTLFSAIDDSWRWRFYTGESIFDTYWVQQLRYLARSKKLGQRRFTFVSLRPAYELGEQLTYDAGAGSGVQHWVISGLHVTTDQACNDARYLVAHALHVRVVVLSPRVVPLGNLLVVLRLVHPLHPVFSVGRSHDAYPPSKKSCRQSKRRCQYGLPSPGEACGC
jgi:uncharacterized membrane protein